MRRLALATVLALAVPAASRAEGETLSRISLGLRIGWEAALGASYADPTTGQAYALSDGFRSQVPVRVEAAVRVAERIAVGAFASYGFDSVGAAVQRTCDLARSSCSAHTFRLGVQGFYRFGEPRPGLTPWAGLGVGWEWSTYEQAGGLSESFSGPEIVNGQAGLDWRVGTRVSIGPWVEAAVGRFGRIDQSAPAPYGSQRVEMRARLHGWLGGGARVTIDL